MRKIIFLLILCFCCNFTFAANSNYEAFNYFYTYNEQNKGYSFNPLTKELYKGLTKDQKSIYKNVLKADKYWIKASSYDKNSYNRIKYLYKAFSLNNSLFPCAEELAFYYLEKEDFSRAEYYFLNIPKEFDNHRDLSLAFLYLWANKNKEAIMSANEFLQQNNISNAMKIMANFILMKAYYNSFDYNSSLKYANILIYNYKEDHKFKYEAWDIRYWSYYNKKDYKNALNVTNQMIKIWGTNELIERIALCTSNKKERIKYLEAAKTELKKKNNNEAVEYINSLIALQKRINEPQKVKQNYTAQKKYNPVPYVVNNSQYEYNSQEEYIPTSNSGQKSITYGYNAQGKYVPVSYGDNKVQYGYNAMGKYVPTSIGNQRVEYGFNAVGNYVPTAIGNNQVNYSYNAVGNYAPSSVGNQQIQYGFNAMGQYVPMSIGGNNIQYGFNAFGEYVPIGY